MNGPDGAGRVLAVAVRVLPPPRRPWGTAMRAELAGIERPAQRWRFALGCARVIATRPAVWRWVGNPLLVVAALVGTVRFTAQVGYPPARWGLTGLVGVLALVACLGRVRPFGPVGAGPAARGVRTVGYLLVGALATEAVWSIAHKRNHDVAGVPVLTVMFVGYLLGFLALTADRSAATGRVLVTGALAGVAAAAGWTAVVLAVPPIPSDPALAVLLTVLGLGLAMTLANRRAGADGGLLAAVCAGTVGSLLIMHVVLVLSVTGPPRLIPDLVPAALSPADDLANSRIELQDPYLWLLLFGWLIAVAQCAVALGYRRPSGSPATVGGVTAGRAGSRP